MISILLCKIESLHKFGLCVTLYKTARIVFLSVECFWTKGYCVVLTRIDSWRPRILSHWQFNDSLALEPINKYTFFLRLLLLGSVCVCFKTKSNPCVWSKSPCSLQHFLFKSLKFGITGRHQTWNLSKILHDRIWGQKFYTLKTCKFWLFLLAIKQRLFQ